MFYVKKRIGDDAEINIDITDENVYTKCARCGCEFPVDICNLAESGTLDLYGLSIMCKDCSAKRIAEMNNEQC